MTSHQNDDNFHAHPKLLGQLLETRIRYPCTECNHPYIFKTKKGLENHKKNKCKRNTPSDKDADLSKIKSERVRNIKPKDVVDRQLSCDICKFPYQYASVLTLNRHKKKCAEKQKGKTVRQCHSINFATHLHISTQIFVNFSAKSKQNDATQLKSTAQNMQSSEIINGVNVETMDLQNGTFWQRKQHLTWCRIEFIDLSFFTPKTKQV